MSAPDRDELVSWLLHRPLFHREGDHVMVHAGILPGWTLEETAERAAAAERALQSDSVGVEEKLGIKLGESTPDGRIYLKKEEECLAACCNAPMMMVNHKYVEDLTTDKVDKVLDALE